MTEPNGTNGRALVVAPKNDAALAMQAAGAPPELVRMAEIQPEIAQRAMAIIASRPVDQWTPALHPARAVAAALYEQSTGQVCGRDFYADNRMGIVPGYRGLQVEIAERNIKDAMDDYRMLRPDELEEHEIGPGDTARVCELSIPSRARACREAGITYKPTIGIGIVRAAEKVNKDGRPIQLTGGFTWVRKARTRAYKDAMRHAGFSATAREVIEDAERAGFDLGDFNDKELQSRLTREQAVHVTKKAKDRQTQAYQEAERRAADLLAAVKADVEEGEIIEHGAPQADPWAEERAFLHGKPPTAIPVEKRLAYAGRCLTLLFGQDAALADAFVKKFFDADLGALDAGQLAGIIEFIGPTQDKTGQYVPSARAIEFAGRFREAVFGPDDGTLFGMDDEE